MKISNGNKLSNGQLFIRGNAMNAPKIGRDGRVPKHSEVTQPAIAFGMKSQTRPDGVHPWLHGQAENDPADDKLHVGKSIPDGYGMRRRTAGEPLTGHDVLTAAGHLSRKE